MVSGRPPAKSYHTGKLQFFEKTRTFSFLTLTLTVHFPSAPETSSSSGANECRFAPCRFGTAPWPLSLSRARARAVCLALSQRCVRLEHMY